MRPTDWASITGIEKVEVDKVVKDYLKIEYRDGGNLYILATGLDVIQKYARRCSEEAEAEQAGRQGMGTHQDEGTQCRQRRGEGSGGIIRCPTAERGLCFWKRYGVAAGVRGNVPL